MSLSVAAWRNVRASCLWFQQWQGCVWKTIHNAISSAIPFLPFSLPLSQSSCIFFFRYPITEHRDRPWRQPCFQWRHYQIMGCQDGNLDFQCLLSVSHSKYKTASYPDANFVVNWWHWGLSLRHRLVPPHVFFPCSHRAPSDSLIEWKGSPIALPCCSHSWSVKIWRLSRWHSSVSLMTVNVERRESSWLPAW